MKTYLLTWNPNKWDWTDLVDEVEEFKADHTITGEWSCGTSKSIEIGDRLYLIRLGKEPKGIFASGYAISTPFQGEHWSGEEDRTANFIELEFDVLCNPEKDPILPIALLKSQFPEQLWSSQNSGISIKSHVAESLNFLWSKLKEFSEYERLLSKENDNTSIDNTFTEGSYVQFISKRYERNPKARIECLTIHGYNCKACDCNFKDQYGDIGENYIHVHHIVPLSKIGKEYVVDPNNDLIPLCPNCHAMIHKGNPVFTLDELKSRIASK